MSNNWLGLGHVTAALGDRVLQERDRDRALELQDRAFSLQKNADQRAQSLTEDQLLSTQRNREAEDAQLAAAGVALPAAERSQFGNVAQYPHADEPDTPPSEPAQDDAAFKSAMPLAGGASAGKAGGKSNGAGSAPIFMPGGAIPPKINQDVARGRATFHQSHERLYSQADQMEAQAKAIQDGLQDVLAKNPYPQGTRGAMIWERAISNKAQAQIGAYRKGAEDAFSQAEATKALNYGGQAAMHLLEGDVNAAAPYLEALKIPVGIFKDMKRTKDGQYWQLAGGGKLTMSDLQALTQGSLEDRMKSFQETAKLVQKDMDRQADLEGKRATAFAAANPTDKVAQAAAQVAKLNAEIRTLKAKNPQDPNIQIKQDMVDGLKGGYNLERNTNVTATNETKEKVAETRAAASVLGNNALVTMTGIPGQVVEGATRRLGQAFGIGAKAPAAPPPAAFQVGQAAKRDDGSVVPDGTYPLPNGGSVTVTKGTVTAVK